MTTTLQRELNFDGATYSPALDSARLTSALGRVYSLMSDGGWRALSEIATACDCSEAGASARLRDLRKPRFGGHTVETDRVAGGLWRYRLIVNQPQE